MAKDKEIRCSAPLEVRAAEGGVVRVEGYAAVFGEWADIGGMFSERIAQGAFDGRLEDDVRFLINHDGLPLARVSSGTLKLSVDARGLLMSADLDPADPDVARIVAKMKRGDLREMSFGFRVDVGGDEWDDTGAQPKRTIKRLKELVDVSIVTAPAYAGTDIGLRSLSEAQAITKQNSNDGTLRRLRMRLRLQGA